MHDTVRSKSQGRLAVHSVHLLDSLHRERNQQGVFDHRPLFIRTGRNEHTDQTVSTNFNRHFVMSSRRLWGERPSEGVPSLCVHRNHSTAITRMLNFSRRCLIRMVCLGPAILVGLMHSLNRSFETGSFTGFSILCCLCCLRACFGCAVQCQLRMDGPNRQSSL